MKLENIQFSDEELKSLKESTLLYHKVKELIIYAEERDPNKKTFLQPTLELKYAFDHLMRVYAYKFGFKSADAEYVDINLHKIFGHVYRAGYDSLDYLSIQFRKELLNEAGDFSPETLVKIFPKYYREIKPDFEIADHEISKIRASKDIGDPNADGLIEYAEIVKRLENHLREFDKIKVSLIEYENEQRKRENDSHVREAILIIVATIIGAIVGVIFV